MKINYEEENSLFFNLEKYPPNTKLNNKNNKVKVVLKPFFLF